MNKAYIFIFDRLPNFDYSVVHNSLITYPSSSNPHIKNWWHYIPNAYIFITSLTTYELQEEIRKQLPSNSNFIIFDITEREYSGWLPREAWDWIKKYTR